MTCVEYIFDPGSGRSSFNGAIAHSFAPRLINHNPKPIAYSLKPGRGDGEVVVRATTGETECRVPRGKTPVLSSDSKWAAVAVAPPFEELEKAEKGDKAMDGLALGGLNVL